MTHCFLVLALLLAIPGVLTFALRRDLRPAIRFAVPFSLPFALTEPFFYPEYWRPAFLFDLADRIGFGLEDLLFVAALAALTVSSYPVAARRTLAALPAASRGARASLLRGGGLLATIGTGVAVTLLLGLPMIYGCLVAMLAAVAVACSRRRDLVVPAAVGALVTTLAYGAACSALRAIDPQVFHTVWRTRELSSVFVLGVPLEELLYGAAAGLAGSVFVPFVRGEAFVPIAPRHEACCDAARR